MSDIRSDYASRSSTMSRCKVMVKVAGVSRMSLRKVKGSREIGVLTRD